MRRALLWLAGVVAFVPSAAGDEIGFVEDFALARDRGAALRQLIPGTEDYYYYYCLHYLNTEQYEQAEALTRPWLERFGQTPRLTEIQTRHALLTYERDPKKSLAYLTRRLNLRFDQQRAAPGAELNLPTAVSARLISRATLKSQSLERWRNLDNFEDTALDWLAAEKLDWERRRNLLQRLQRPDVPDLEQLVAEDLRSPHPPEFGSLIIHRQLTLAQLEALLKLQPGLLNHTAFVAAYLSKLHPGADEDWRHVPELTRAYLDRLWEFVRRLSPAHNTLKAHVLYHRLVFDRSQGVYDLPRFVEYLKLPRRQPYMAKRLLEAEESQRFPVDLAADFRASTLLQPVGSDEPLVRSCLLHFLAGADSPAEFEPYINDVYLRQVFAEVKIVNGLGEPEQWASQLPPEVFRQLKERVDLDFAFTYRTDFAAEQPVRLDLFVKNVPNLIVRVFEINTANYYRQHRREVDTDINLDGLVATVEQTHAYGEPPLRRVARRFEFPQLSRPGVYVIDFIGAGKSSRALVRKGRLRPLVTTTSAGQLVSVVDDANRLVKDASLWLGGQDFRADADGTILIPFSTEPGRRPVVLSRGDFACLDYLSHQGEAHELTAGIHVDRESLLAQRMAAVVVRPGVRLNGQPVSVRVLEDVKLRLTSTDQDGIATTLEVPNFKLFEDRESVYEFRVPPRLASLTVTLEARVKILSQNKEVSLAAAETFGLNGIAKTDKIEDLHLARFGPDYVLELRGRTGEPRPGRPVQLSLKHRDFKEPVQTTLKTDTQGRVHLGPLEDITNVTATGPEGTAHTWPLLMDRHTYRHLVDARAGEVVTLPYVGAAGKATREELALFEVEGDVIRTDRFDALAVRDGSLELRALAAGDYDLWLKRTGERLRIRVVDGPAVRGHVLGRLRHLELPALKPVQITAINADAGGVTVRLRDVSPYARVHVFATRYRPAFSPYDNLARVRAAELSGVYPAHAESAYVTGRNIGDEYRYVLDRKYQKKFPGNMLERPSLLLNPWAVRSTETGEQQAKGGEEFKPKGAPAASVPAPSEAAAGGNAAATGDFANLDFLADASAVLVNLVPDKDGVVRVTSKEIGLHAVIHVVAVDPLSTTYRSIALPEQPARFLDLALREGLDPKGHFTQQRQVTLLQKGQPFVLADVAASRFEAYDSLAKVYGLYATLSRDPKLAEFAFLLNWPKLKSDEKRSLYSKHACHELHFFLARKDPEFFREVVKPYLANKKDKTFLDRWLLEGDLRAYLQPWPYGRLNAVERILLGQRIPEEPARTARDLADLLRVRPPAAERARLAFLTALQGGELNANEELGIDLGSKVRYQREKLERKPDEAPPPPRDDAARPNSSAGINGPKGEALKEAGSEKYAPAKRRSGEFGRGLGGAPGMPGRPGGGQAFGMDSTAVDKDGQFKELGDLEHLFLDDTRANRLGRQLYRRLDPTQEWAEDNYYHLPIQQQTAELVPVNAFWLDYARHDGKGPFLSQHLAEPTRNFTDMLLALAVLDLPFEAPRHEVKFDGPRMTLTPAGPVVAFHEQVRPAAPPAGRVPVLLSENFYRHGDRFREEEGEKLDKFVTGEFLVHAVYGCQVVVTNPTSSRQRLTVLLQVPVGAIPVGDGRYTKAVPLDLEPYRTQAVDYNFYFPRPGRFAHLPAQVARNEQLVAAAAPVTFEVVERPTKPDTGSWDYVSQNGTAEQVLAFLERENLHALDLNKIAFRLRDRAFFEAVVALLQARHAYHPVVWSYGLYHNDVAAAREFLLHADPLVAQVGGPLVSPLLTVDPVARHQYEHLEYRPLVNARAHALGRRRQIVNPRLSEQYHRFLLLLAHRRQLGDDDRLAVTYYLLLQDRIDEAQATFVEVDAGRLATRLQYDYCAAYLDMYSDEPHRARAIAAGYAQHPVDRWRNAFAAILHQLDEAEGKGPQVADVQDRGQRQGQLAATEPGFEFTLDGRQLHLSWQHLGEVRVNYYLMDVELLFSRNPFTQQVGGQFAAVKPNRSQVVQLPAGQSRLDVPLPEDLAGRNVLVEVSAAGKAQSLPHYAGSLDVRLLENYGQVRVAEAAGGKPLAKAYVKVYARLANGQVKFHKDGYTDHRGRFDYASVSTPEQQPIARFVLLVLDENRGALIREAGAPQQ
jgi:hypothetical protein